VDRAVAGRTGGSAGLRGPDAKGMELIYQLRTPKVWGQHRRGGSCSAVLLHEHTLGMGAVYPGCRYPEYTQSMAVGRDVRGGW
jgi:hypothetical protein